VISSPTKIALVADTDHDYNLAEIREQFVRGVDLILSEGYKRESHLKIEVFRSELRQELLCQGDDRLLAIAGDYPDPPRGVHVFDLNAPGPLCDLIVERVIKKAANAADS
jgi:molybdopterin-guanine dinucleotide biosynthesis protein B